MTSRELFVPISRSRLLARLIAVTGLIMLLACINVTGPISATGGLLHVRSLALWILGAILSLASCVWRRSGRNEIAAFGAVVAMCGTHFVDLFVSRLFDTGLAGSWLTGCVSLVLVLCIFGVWQLIGSCLVALVNRESVDDKTSS